MVEGVAARLTRLPNTNPEIESAAFGAISENSEPAVKIWSGILFFYVAVICPLKLPFQVDECSHDIVLMSIDFERYSSLHVTGRSRRVKCNAESCVRALWKAVPRLVLQVKPLMHRDAACHVRGANMRQWVSGLKNFVERFVRACRFASAGFSTCITAL